MPEGQGNFEQAVPPSDGIAALSSMNQRFQQKRDRQRQTTSRRRRPPQGADGSAAEPSVPDDNAAGEHIDVKA